MNVLGEGMRPRDIVVKEGYRAGANNKVLEVVKGLNTPDRRFVVVHGGGDLITQFAQERGLHREKAPDGQWITSRETLYGAVIPALSVVNEHTTWQLQRLGVRAGGFNAGVQNTALVHGYKDIPKGEVAKDVEVDLDFLQRIHRRGITPVVAPISRSWISDLPLNTNADVFAAAFPGDLFFVTDTPGVLDERREVVDVLTPGLAAEFIAAGVINEGMMPKTKSALKAAEAREATGSESEVIICDAEGLAAILRGEPAGTRVRTR